MKVNHSSIVLFLFILMFFADGANSLLENSGSAFTRTSIFVRAVAEIYFLWLLVRAGRVKVLLFLLVMILVFALGTLVGQDLYEDIRLFDNFNVVNKMFYFFIVFETLRMVFPSEEERQKLFKLYEVVVLLQVAIIMVGFVFDIRILSAYIRRSGEIWRFGYQGFIPAQNEISLFFILAFFYFLTKWHYAKASILPVLFVFIGALLTGTRVSLFVFPATVLYLVWSGGRALLSGGMRLSRFAYVTIGVFALAALAFWQQGYILERITPTLNYFSSQLRNRGYGTDYKEMFVGLFSGRQGKFSRFSQEDFPNFGWANYLLGGYDITSNSVEMDIVDVFARFGAIGFALFYGNYLRCLFYPVRRPEFIHLLFVGVWLGVSALAGHVVGSAVNAGYLAILLLAFAQFIPRQIVKTQEIRQNAGLGAA